MFNNSPLLSRLQGAFLFSPLTFFTFQIYLGYKDVFFGLFPTCSFWLRPYIRNWYLLKQSTVIVNFFNITLLFRVRFRKTCSDRVLRWLQPDSCREFMTKNRFQCKTYFRWTSKVVEGFFSSRKIFTPLVLDTFFNVIDTSTFWNTILTYLLPSSLTTNLTHLLLLVTPDGSFAAAFFKL